MHGEELNFFQMGITRDFLEHFAIEEVWVRSDLGGRIKVNQWRAYQLQYVASGKPQGITLKQWYQYISSKEALHSQRKENQ
jgi:hypothetical protein